MITEADIEKIIYRCFENYWNTRMSKTANLAHVSKIAGNDVWKVISQYMQCDASFMASTNLGKLMLYGGKLNPDTGEYEPNDPSKDTCNGN